MYVVCKGWCIFGRSPDVSDRAMTHACGVYVCEGRRDGGRQREAVEREADRIEVSTRIHKGITLYNCLLVLALFCQLVLSLLPSFAPIKTIHKQQPENRPLLRSKPSHQLGFPFPRFFLVRGFPAEPVPPTYSNTVDLWLHSCNISNSCWQCQLSSTPPCQSPYKRGKN